MNLLVPLALWEIGCAYYEKVERRRLFRQARAEARRRGKPLLVVGEPDGEYPCGDLLVDLRARSVCRRHVRTSVERMPMFRDKQFGAAFCVPDIVLAGIQTPTGTRRPSQIHVGDSLVTVDRQTGKLVETTVVEVLSRRTTGYLTIQFEDETARALPLTEEHPVLTARGWVKAGQLVVGDEVLSVRRGERIDYVRQRNPSWRGGLSRAAVLRHEREPDQLDRAREQRRSGRLRTTRMSAAEKQLHSDKMRRLNLRAGFRESLLAKSAVARRLLRRGRMVACSMCGAEFYAGPQRLGGGTRYCTAACMWSDPDYAEKMMRAIYSRPTKVESFVIEAIQQAQLPIHYVGNGKVWIGSRATGIANPDFVVDGQKKVIEVFVPGPQFGRVRGPEYVAGKVAFYATHGYECLCLPVSGHAFYRNRTGLDPVSRELRHFVSNGWKVKEVRRVASNVSVYNYRCEPHDTFLVNGAVVHNCSHVIEHVERPMDALRELNRVADRVFISYPRPWRLTTYLVPGHTWLMVPNTGGGFNFFRLRQTSNIPNRYGLQGADDFEALVHAVDRGG